MCDVVTLVIPCVLLLPCACVVRVMRVDDPSIHSPRASPPACAWFPVGCLVLVLVRVLGAGGAGRWLVRAHPPRWCVVCSVLRVLACCIGHPVCIRCGVCRRRRVVWGRGGVLCCAGSGRAKPRGGEGGAATGVDSCVDGCEWMDGILPKIHRNHRNSALAGIAPDPQESWRFGPF